ncbi:MAG: tryptophan synthase subunit alpha, partial [Chloroflexi bacterium]|nr:tryptophan synthase subunit alpha [Chloroflexota bacterium]
IELGIPFSDPLADGATIQKASYLALQRGATPELCLELAGRLSGKVGAPLVFMTYYNPVLNFGPERFCRSCREAGVRGLIVPDLPPDEGGELESLTRRHGLDLVYLLAPNSSEERIKLVAARSRGFIYLVSLTGVTGARESLPRELEDFVLRVRRHAGQPLCVGFGISSTAQAARIAQTADGVIVGSRFIQLIEEDPSLTALGKFVAALRRAVDGRKDEPGANPP